MTQTAARIPPAPRGRDLLAWIGPGIIWMVSAIATGELLFTPRVASLYGYALLWAMIAAIVLKTLLSIEIGRYAVTTGGSILHGMRQIPGPANWGVWLLVLPQFFVAVTTMVGMAGATSSAFILFFPGDFRLWGIVFLALSTVLVYAGRYRAVELASIIMALTITAALVVAASIEFPGVAPLLAGIVPALPQEIDYTEILPWLGFLMSGAAGLIWYSYWLPARGYGAAHSLGAGDGSIEEFEPVDPAVFDAGEQERLRKWIRVMAITTGIAASIVLVQLFALLILGAELLRPEGLLPEGPAVTAVLSRLLGEVWGPAGAWMLIVAALFAFWSTMIANLDGWVRMLGQGSIFIARRFVSSGRLVSMGFYRPVYLFGLMGVLPAVFLIVRPEPVTFLIVAGSSRRSRSRSWRLQPCT
ncbi:divalent metal cation transporter [Methanoculleus sp. FWC-SCC1]|uniref:Divalent metal cation transporter n=1 Tax=Methanoculleus frigidifontis TaxID=2584085 RepID=A0ABT8M9M3_9EURY|nr:Nramp family divalent metal transporter [Methanoculleus sp. FWC-SCC1]MDN7024625.1 divalent metal cation transporter [Methanoculleus sp. FWC-SCC1]